MSFLNPVNEPVTLFSSIDADAPQINYAARTAGDVKAVLKACLVTGYGDKARAGWSIVNEAGDVAEFASPSAAMSDYRLGIDDAAVPITTWYCDYRGARIDPAFNTPAKSIKNIDKSHVDNGWTLIVTQRGIWFLEHFYHSVAAGISSRLTYWGQSKLAASSQKNVFFYCMGHDGSDWPYMDLRQVSKLLLHTDANAPHSYLGTTPFISAVSADYDPQSDVDLYSDLYLCDSGGSIIAQQVGLLALAWSANSEVYGIKNIALNSRPCIKICAGIPTTTSSYAYRRARNYIIYLDYWEY